MASPVLIAATAILTAIASPALASPFVYTTGGLLNTDLSTCLSDAEKAAKETGFTQDQEKALDEDKKDGTFFASKPDAPVSLVVRCAPTYGVVTIAVSGINNDVTFEEYGRFNKVFFK